ncbi:YkoP family protein [Crassaminicella profunda]|uniref:YkoP family protein n=1 Tax=Crassaminicella profunda TaxID=1286698 RepID=UPI001CA68346|nr:hypothetical protein [Crassaminicella profunda]QZY56391.1 hypothetical protein K7H06_05550 [Crassaminicella profunda]
MKKLFKLIERSVVKINNWKHVPNSKRKLLYICPHVYKGRTIEILDGTMIKNGDVVAEMHIDNLKVDQLENDYRKLFRRLKEELQALSNLIINEKEFEEIKAYHGTTLLYPLAKKQGFTIVEMDKGPKKYFLILWENILRIVFKKDKKIRDRLRTPKECWISKGQLLQKYIGT